MHHANLAIFGSFLMFNEISDFAVGHLAEFTTTEASELFIILENDIAIIQTRLEHATIAKRQGLFRKILLAEKSK